MKTLDEYFEEYEDVSHSDVVRELHATEEALSLVYWEMHLYKARAERAENLNAEQDREIQRLKREVRTLQRRLALWP